jgi:tRNA-2-methylthio-N6-dimethylallyladenosine synthase
VGIATDIIVAFPGETDEQFRETLNLLSDLKFDTVHVAAYSVRPGTSAARDLLDNVPAAEKKARLAAVEAQQEAISSEINGNFRGHAVEVLVEGRKRGKWWGRSRGDRLVFFTGDASPGELHSIEVTETGPWSLRGTLK